MSLQFTFLALMGIIDTILVSPLGDLALSSVGIGARWLTFVSMLLFCLASCAQVLLSHSKGAADGIGFKMVAHLGSVHVVTLSFILGVLFFLFPLVMISAITNSEEVGTYGKDFIKIIGAIIFLTGICVSVDAILRSEGRTRESLYANIVEILVNIVLAYILIYGYGIIPALGIVGVGIASLTARFLRAVTLIIILWKLKNIQIFSIGAFHDALDFPTIKKYYLYAWPLIVSSLAWSAGVFVMHAIMGHMGELELAAMSFIAPFETLAVCFVSGISNAASILIGQSLGANQNKRAYSFAIDSIQLASAIGIITAIASAISVYFYLTNLSNIESATRDLIIMIIPCLSLAIITRSIAGSLMHGILKAGGDNKYCMYVDMLCQWSVSIPLVFFAASVLNFSLFEVYLLIQIEGVLKIILCLPRVIAKKWIRNLA